MKIFIAILVLCVAVFIILMSPVFAQPAADVVVCVPHNPYGLNFCPLVPVINNLVTAVAGIITLAIPVLVFYAGVWLRNHGIAAKQDMQKMVSDRITTTIQNGLKFAGSGADVGAPRLTVQVDDPNVRQAANYAIAQSPDLLKKAGIDITTEAGQQTLVRRIIAESQPPSINAPPVLDVNVKSS